MTLSRADADWWLQACDVVELDGHGFDAEAERDADGRSLACIMPPNGAYFGRLRSPGHLTEVSP